MGAPRSRACHDSGSASSTSCMPAVASFSCQLLTMRTASQPATTMPSVPNIRYSAMPVTLYIRNSAPTTNAVSSKGASCRPETTIG